MSLNYLELLNTNFEEVNQIKNQVITLQNHIHKLDAKMDTHIELLYQIRDNLNGIKGPTGDKGPIGDKGHLGNKGPMGDKGLIGDKGPTGDKGPSGDKGLDSYRKFYSGAKKNISHSSLLSESDTPKKDKISEQIYEEKLEKEKLEKEKIDNETINRINNLSEVTEEIHNDVSLNGFEISFENIEKYEKSKKNKLDLKQLDELEKNLDYDITNELDSELENIRIKIDEISSKFEKTKTNEIINFENPYIIEEQEILTPVSILDKNNVKYESKLIKMIKYGKKEDEYLRFGYCVIDSDDILEDYYTPFFRCIIDETTNCEENIKIKDNLSDIGSDIENDFELILNSADNIFDNILDSQQNKPINKNRSIDDIKLDDKLLDFGHEEHDLESELASFEPKKITIENFKDKSIRSNVDNDNIEIINESKINDINNHNKVMSKSDNLTDEKEKGEEKETNIYINECIVDKYDKNSNTNETDIILDIQKVKSKDIKNVPLNPRLLVMKKLIDEDTRKNETKQKKIEHKNLLNNLIKLG
jgi:hypothetical protein